MSTISFLLTAAIWFCDFEGGELVVETPEGEKVFFTEKRLWHHYKGARDPHYNFPHTGIKLSVIAWEQ